MGKTVPTATAPDSSGNAPQRLGLRPREAAKMLGISERHLWSKTKAGEVPHFRLGRRVIYPVAGLERWLTEQATAAAKGAR